MFFLNNFLNKNFNKCIFIGKGYTPTLMAIIPHSGLDLAVYETLKSFTKKYQKSEPKAFQLFLMSSVSCMIGQVSTYPLALMTTRMQAHRKFKIQLNFYYTVFF